MLDITSIKFPSKHKSIEVSYNEKLILEQWIIPKYCKIKLYTGRDFGYVILRENQKDVNGSIIPKRIFRY